jgi:hypothetical protein
MMSYKNEYVAFGNYEVVDYLALLNDVKMMILMLDICCWLSFYELLFVN